MTADDLDAKIAAFQLSIEERDVEAASDLLDEDFALVLVHPARAVMPKARWLEVLPDYIVHSYEVFDSIVDGDGDCATVLQRAHQVATVLGSDRSGVFVVSDVWRLRNTGWQLWRRHSTPLTAGDMPGV